MRIDRVTYHYLNNLGDYRNERIEMSAQLDEGEQPEEAIAKLKDRVLALAGENATELEHRRWKLIDQVRELEKRCAQARENWEATAEFLKAQGLRSDAPAFPENLKLLPAAAEVDAHLDAVPF